MKKIIIWLINFLKKLFGIGKKRRTRKIVQKEINTLKKKEVVNKYNTFIDISDNINLPNYFMITKEERDILINKVLEIKEKVINIDNASCDILDNIIMKLKEVELSF